MDGDINGDGNVDFKDFQILHDNFGKKHKDVIDFYSKDFTQIVQSWITIAAFIIGAIWTYLIFIRTRQKFPRAIIKHNIHHIELKDTNKICLHIEVKVTNVGNVLITLEEGYIRVQHLLPLDKEYQKTLSEKSDLKSQDYLDKLNINQRGLSQIQWHLLDSYRLKWENAPEIEPQESDIFEFDFILDNDVECARIYSHFKNIVKSRWSRNSKPLGWKGSTFYHFE